MSVPYTITFQYQPPLLRARVEGGDSSMEVTLAYWLRIAEEVRARGAELLLFVDGVDGPVMTDPDLSRFFDGLAGNGLEQVRIAYVERSLEQMDRIEHAEIMARERGLHARVFAHEAQALDWLRYGE